VRARRTSAPAVRATLGSRSGPSTSSATTAISAISLKPTSNMAGTPAARRCRRSGVDALGLRALGRRVRRGVGMQLRLLVVAVLHALLEALDGAADILADVAQALGAEYQCDDHQHDQPV